MNRILFILLLISSSAFAQVQIYSSGGTVGANKVIIDTSTAPFPMTVTVIPGSGDTSLAEYSTTIGAAVNGATANWQTINTMSAMTSATTQTLPSRVQAVRFTRSAGTSADVFELNGGY